ncbi:MAG: cyclic nucleotide-binding domain-containing protein [Candidatus Porifericomitaceae bacterium WSBS_2022_MAG_OTU9]
MADIDPSLIRNIDIFGPLSGLALEQIIDAPENAIEEYKANDYIVREAEEAQFMYVVVEGSVEILIRGGASGRQIVGDDREVPIATLHTGDFFGEQALYRNSEGTRNASVRAETNCKLFRIHKKYVELNIKRDLDMTMTSITMIELPQDKEVREILETMRLFKSLNADEISSFREWTEIMEISVGELVVRDREPAESIFVVLDGELEVYVLNQSKEEINIGILRKGNYFGEGGMLGSADGIRNAFVRGKSNCRLIKIPKNYFRVALKRDPSLGVAVKVVDKARKQKIIQAKKSG